ncbi:hypothetical protein WJX74_007280 [Apatococcus lobatus]|uniref:Uncharacterized protein n=2 Tax=Apatococcus TaxID=904362 RepID=A0AAW1SV05_9CHLO
MGWRTFCCVRPQDVDRPEKTLPGQTPATAHKFSGEPFPAAHTPGGRTLIVTAQSGSARELEGYLRRDTPDLKVRLPEPTLRPTPDFQADKRSQGDDTQVRKELPSTSRAEVSAARSDSCPAGDMQRPPNSLIEASIRRRQRAGRPRATQHPASTHDQGLDDRQLATIRTFMSVYKANLDGTSCQLVEEMSTLLAEGLVLRAHDGKVYHGQAASLRRLQHGASQQHLQDDF